MAGSAEEPDRDQGALSNTDQTLVGLQRPLPPGQAEMTRRAHEAPLAKAAGSREAVASPPEAGRYVLRLYVTGMTLRSMQAIANLRAICETRLQGRYELEVVDIYQHPRLARDEQIVAAPTLIRKLPLPLRRMVGNLSDEERVLMGLDLRVRTA